MSALFGEKVGAVVPEDWQHASLDGWEDEHCLFYAPGVD